jgi:hypothetical protein
VRGSLWVSIFAVTALISACSSPPHQLPQSGESRSFDSPQETAVIYRKIVEGARTCYAKKEVVADFFPDNKSGRVSMSVKTSLNIASLFMAEIDATKDGSLVKVYFLKGNPVFADAVEQWSKGNYTLCPFS